MNISQARIAALNKIMAMAKCNSTNTQCFRFEQALKKLGSITTYECSRYLDIYSPTARKFELVKKGWKITSTKCKVTTESGELHDIGNYILQSLPKKK